MGKTAERSVVPVDEVVELDLGSGFAEDLDGEDDLVVLDLGLAAASLELPDEDLLGHERRRR